MWVQFKDALRKAGGSRTCVTLPEDEARASPLFVSC